MEMDTPERTQIASSSTPISKFEDSPVFNYINNLSPIKPVKSIHITQTFSSLTFASLPSIFTSPHVSSHKESRFLRRHQNLDSSKLKSLSGDVERASTNEGAEAELQDNFEAGISIASASVEQLSEQTEFAIELPRTLKYDCGSPDCGANQEIAHDINQPEGEANLGNKQAGPGCDWENLVSDTADLLIFSSPNDAEAFRGIIQKSPGLGTGLGASPSSSFLQNSITDVQKMQLFFQVASDKHPEIGDASESTEIKHTQEDLGSDVLESMGIYPSDGFDNEAAPHDPFADIKPLSNLQRGMRRRCLDFEMVGAHKRKTLSDSSSYLSSLSHSEDKITMKNLQLAPVNNKRKGESSRCILPGIGLHLNSLASAKRDYKAIKHDTLSSETQPSNMTNQELLPQPMLLTASEKEADESENVLSEDTSQALVLLNPEEPNPSSPRKKRRRNEHGGEAENCKRCNCKKSKCLKLYCECFAAGVYCIEPCACQDCFNKPIHEDTVLATRKQIESRNPLAFAPKVIRGCSDSVAEIGDESMKTPASARHKRGCNCKKSSCLKKYCECYQGGVGCSINCRCEGCKNAFGTKDGSVPVGTECEAEDEETEKCEMADVIPAKTENPRSEEQVHPAALPSTPSGMSRPPVPMAFPPSKGKPPRSSFLTTIGSSYVLKGTQKLGKTEFLLPPPPKSENPPQLNAEEDMPEILRGSTTPSDSIKTASPNRKRVSPPHGEFGSSPSLRSGRRLILQSIPSFPSLTPQH